MSEKAKDFAGNVFRWETVELRRRHQCIVIVVLLIAVVADSFVVP